MSGSLSFPALPWVEKPAQSCFKHLRACEGVEQSHVVILSFKQFETLHGARDKEGFLFIAVDSGFDQDGAVSVVIVDGQDVPSLSAGMNDQGDGVSLLGRNAAQSPNDNTVRRKWWLHAYYWDGLEIAWPREPGQQERSFGSTRMKDES